MLFALEFLGLCLEGSVEVADLFLAFAPFRLELCCTCLCELAIILQLSAFRLLVLEAVKARPHLINQSLVLGVLLRDNSKAILLKQLYFLLEIFLERADVALLTLEVSTQLLDFFITLSQLFFEEVSLFLSKLQSLLVLLLHRVVL